MGWTVTPGTTCRKQWDAEFGRTWQNDAGQEVSVGEPVDRGACWWGVASLDGVPSFVVLALMEGPREPGACGEVAVKVMTEHEGPLYYSCPVRFLKATSEPKPGSFAAKWRAEVRKRRRFG